MSRTKNIARQTNETEINLSLNLDGNGQHIIDTGIGIFDHMLELFSRHSKIDIDIDATGDIHVDSHHLVEDLGIVLGTAIKEALGDKGGIKRYGSMLLPMDEALCEVVLDLSGRGHLVYNVPYLHNNLGDMDMEMVEEFFRAVAVNAGITLHINLRYGKNNHHISEAVFKGFARALGEAISVVDDTSVIPSTKGVL